MTVPSGRIKYSPPILLKEPPAYHWGLYFFFNHPLDKFKVTLILWVVKKDETKTNPKSKENKIMNRKEMETKIDFNVNEEKVLDRILNNQIIKKAIQKDSFINVKINCKELLQGINTPTLLYVVEKNNIENLMLFIINGSDQVELPNTIEEFLFNISADLLKKMNQILGGASLSNYAIIHEIVCDELAEKYRSDYNEIKTFIL